MLFGRDLAIDMGTKHVRVAAGKKGVLLNEPSVVAIDRNTGKLLKTGVDAQRMLGRTPGNIVALMPIRQGVIYDYDMTVHMLREMIKKVSSFSLVKPRLIMSVPSGITEVEERAVIDAGLQAGARRVYLMEAPLAAALGAGMDISDPEGHMIVDVGGGTTDAAVLSLDGVVESDSIKDGGVSFDEAVVRYIRKKHNILIGEGTAAELKRSVGCVFPRPDTEPVEIKGRCLMTGLPRTVSVSSDDMQEAYGEVMERILEMMLRILEATPPELVADISKNGIVLTGGGSLVWGFDRFIESRTNITTHSADDAELCVAYGLNRSLAKLDDMDDGTINLARSRQLRM